MSAAKNPKRQFEKSNFTRLSMRWNAGECQELTMTGKMEPVTSLPLPPRPEATEFSLAIGQELGRGGKTQLDT